MKCELITSYPLHDSGKCPKDKIRLVKYDKNDNFLLLYNHCDDTSSLQVFTKDRKFKTIIYKPNLHIIGISLNNSGIITILTYN